MHILKDAEYDVCMILDFQKFFRGKGERSSKFKDMNFLNDQQTIPVNNQLFTAAPSETVASVESLPSRSILAHPPPKTPVMFLNELCWGRKGIQPNYDLQQIDIDNSFSGGLGCYNHATKRWK